MPADWTTLGVLPEETPLGVRYFVVGMLVRMYAARGRVTAASERDVYAAKPPLRHLAEEMAGNRRRVQSLPALSTLARERNLEAPLDDCASHLVLPCARTCFLRRRSAEPPSPQIFHVAALCLWAGFAAREVSRGRAKYKPQ